MTAVYVSNKNDFWNYRKKDPTALPLYFMAVQKIPFVFSILANPINSKSDFWQSFNYSKIVELNGTIHDFNKFNKNDICKNILKLKIDNIIVFGKSSKIEEIIECKKN